MDSDYLDPNFDPSTLTVVNLRKVLFNHGHTAPSQSKKADLIKLFNENIAANADELRAQRDSVTADGSSILIASENDNTMKLTSRSSSRRSSVRTKQKTEREPSLTPSGYSSDEEEKPKISSPLRNTRTSMLEPSARKTPIVIKKDAEDIDPENPFQSYRASNSKSNDTKLSTPSKSSGAKSKPGSSKPDDDKIVTNGKQTTPSKPASAKSSARSTGKSKSQINGNSITPAKNSTDEADADSVQKSSQSKLDEDSISSIHSTSSRRSTRLQNSSAKKSHQTPSHSADNSILSTKSKSSHTKKSSLTPIDESTPKIPSPLRDSLSNRPQNLTYNQEVMNEFRHRKEWGVVKSILYYILGAITLVYLIFYRFEKVKLGYTDTNETNVPQEKHPFDFIRPVAMRCPDHAICANQAIQGCEEGFKLREHPLSNRILPFFPPRCIPDTDKKIQINTISDEVIQLLSNHRGEVECTKPLSPPSLPLDQVKKYILEHSAVDTTLENFDDLFEDAIENISKKHQSLINIYSETNELIKFKNNEFDIKQIGTLISIKPNYALGCRIKISLKNLIFNNLSKLLNALGLIAVVSLVYLWTQNKSREQLKVNDLTAQTLDILINASQSQTPPRPGFSNPASIPIYQLRDLLMAEEYPNVRLRQKLWKQVIHKVEKNSNIRVRSIQIKGEPQEVWEWIGFAPAASSSSGFFTRETPSKINIDASGTSTTIPATAEENLYPNLDNLL